MLFRTFCCSLDYSWYNYFRYTPWRCPYVYCWMNFMNSVYLWSLFLYYLLPYIIHWSKTSILEVTELLTTWFHEFLNLNYIFLWIHEPFNQRKSCYSDKKIKINKLFLCENCWNFGIRTRTHKDFYFIVDFRLNFSRFLSVLSHKRLKISESMRRAVHKTIIISLAEFSNYYTIALPISVLTFTP